LPRGTSALDDDDYRWLQVWSRDGRLLFASSTAVAEPIAVLASPPSDRALSLDLGHGIVRVKEESGHIAGHPVIVRAVTSEARLHQEIAEFLWLVALAAPVVAGLAALGVYHLVRRTLRPVDRLVAGANGITADPAGCPPAGRQCARRGRSHRAGLQCHAGEAGIVIRADAAVHGEGVT
jgi:hypothetical protein